MYNVYNILASNVSIRIPFIFNLSSFIIDKPKLSLNLNLYSFVVFIGGTLKRKNTFPNKSP